MIPFFCPSCHHLFIMPAVMSGWPFPCKCGQSVTVPGPKVEPPKEKRKPRPLPPEIAVGKIVWGVVLGVLLFALLMVGVYFAVESLCIPGDAPLGWEE